MSNLSRNAPHMIKSPGPTLAYHDKFATGRSSPDDVLAVIIHVHMMAAPATRLASMNDSVTVHFGYARSQMEVMAMLVAVSMIDRMRRAAADCASCVSCLP